MIELAADASEDSYDTDVCEAEVVPLGPPRALDWPKILQHIPAEEKDATKAYILTEALDFFVDGDHPVGYKTLDDTVLRFVPQTQWIQMAWDHKALDLNALAAVPMAVLERRQFYRDLNYSLQRYGEVSLLGHRGQFRRHMCERAPARVVSARRHLPV